MKRVQRIFSVFLALIALPLAGLAGETTLLPPTPEQFGEMADRLKWTGQTMCGREGVQILKYAPAGDPADTEWFLILRVDTGRPFLVIHWEPGADGKPDRLWEDWDGDGAFERFTTGQEAPARWGEVVKRCTGQ